MNEFQPHSVREDELLVVKGHGNGVGKWNVRDKMCSVFRVMSRRNKDTGPEHEGVCVGLRPDGEISRPGLQQWASLGAGCLHHRALGQDTVLVMWVLFRKISLSLLLSLMIYVIGSSDKTFMQNRESTQKNTHTKSLQIPPL